MVGVMDSCGGAAKCKRLSPDSARPPDRVAGIDAGVGRRLGW